MESDKENIQVMEPLPQTPKRAPFQELGNTQPKSATPMFLKRAQYSQVTPFYTPKVKTPLRQKVQVPCAMRILTDSADVPLNSLIYKKVIGIINEKDKEHEQMLEEKEAEIARLNRQLQMISLPQDKATNAVTSTTCSASSPSVPMPGTPDTVDCGCSPYPTPTPLFPKQVHQEHPYCQDSAETELDKPDSVPSSPKLTLGNEEVSKDDSFSFLPQLDSLCSLELDSLCALELAQAWNPDNSLQNLVFDDSASCQNAESTNTGTISSNSPCLPNVKNVVTKHSEATQTTPKVESEKAKSFRDANMCTSPVHAHASEPRTSPVKVHETAQNTSPLRTATIETMVTPVKLNSISVNTTPVNTHSQGTCRTPLTLTSTETMVTPVRVSSVGSCTSPLVTHSAETNTERVCGVDAETMARPVSSDASSQCTFQASTQSQETCTTPPRQVVDCGTITDPLCHAVPRPSEIDFSSLGVSDLALRLESAAVSNTLLRGQIEALHQDKTSALRKVALTAGEQRQWEEERAQLQAEAARREKLAKMAVSTQVEELMEQQAQMLGQISSLQAEVERKEEALADASAAHDKQKAGLNAELANLRKDLVAAYQQRKQEVEELKTRYMATDYQPHYQRARQSVQLLESQLAAFTGLMEEIRQAQQLQDRAADVVSRRAQEVEEKMALVNQHFKQHRQWEQQRKEVEDELAEKKEKMNGSEAELEQFQKQLSEADQSVSQLKEQLEKYQEQEKVHFVEQESLKAALKIQEDETTSLKESLTTKTGEVSELTREVGDLRTALNSQTEHMSRLSQERDRYMNLSTQQRTSLTALRAGARRAEELEKELDNLRAEHKLFKDDYFKMVKDFSTEVEFLTTESAVQLAEDTRTQQRMTELQEENEQTKSQLSQAQDELEATRALHLMMLQRRENEMQMSVNAFDGLTEKVTLLQTRVGFCHLQCSSSSHGSLEKNQDANTQSQVQTCDEKNSRKSVRKSFISSILSAVNGESPTVNIPDTIADCEVPVSSETAEQAETDPLHARITDLGLTLEDLLTAVQQVADNLGDMAALRTELVQLQQQIEAQASTIDRYKNQKIKLNYNWKMAETELKNLEKLIETVREVLCSHEAEIRSSWREAHRLHRLGMFSSDDTTKLLQYDPESITKTC